MKRFILKSLVLGTLALVISSFSLAKVSDFNALIEENISAQKELHGQIKQQMNTTTQALQVKASGSQSAAVFVDDSTEQINAPTSTRILQYKREKSQKSVSKKKQMERISQEFDEADSSY